MKIKGLVPLRWLNCQGDTLANVVEIIEDREATKEKSKTHHPRSLKSKWQEIARLSNFSGGAGGSAASNRIRQERELLEGLKQLLGGLNGQGRGRERSRSTSPQPPSRSRSPSPGWRTKGEGKKKGNGKTQTKTKTAEEPSPSGPRRVTWEQDGLLAELKALVLQAEVHRGTGPSLISELQKLVSKYAIETAEPPPNSSGTKTVAPWNGNPKKENSSQTLIKPCSQWWPKITTQKEFVDALDLGEIPKESAAVIGTFDQFLGWKQLALTHQIKYRFAVICQDITDPATASEKESCEFKWVKLRNGVWKKFGVMPLSVGGMPEWPSEPKKLDGCEKGSEEKALATFRVLIPKRFVTASTWDAALKKPVQLLAGALPDGLAFRSYGWHRNQDAKEEAILGFVKIPLEEKDVPGSRSGWNSVLFQPILDSQQNRHETPIKWIPCTQKSSIEYFQEVKRQAQNQKVGIAIRRGGKNCLGLLGVKDESCPAELVRRRWIARYVPVHWNPQQFLEILQTKGWRTIDEIQPPNHKGGLWCFKATPPPGCGEACEMSVGSGKSVVFSPWFPKRPQPPKTVPLKSTFKGWVANGPTTEEVTKAEVQHDQKNDEIGETQLDSQTQQDVDMGDGQQKRGAEDSPAKPAAKTIKLSSPQKGKGTSSPSLGPDNYQMWDLGGCGNCGFRCLAATMAYRNKKPPDQILTRIDTLALTLRSKCVTWLKKHNSWKDSWFVDADASNSTEDGPPATSVIEYLEVAQRPQKWLDSWMCQASCEVLQCPIIAWKFVRNKWVFFYHFIPESPSAKNNPPIALFLRAGHFTTLPADTKIPTEWLNLKNKETFGVSFLGGGLKRSSKEQSGVDFENSCSSWLRPRSHITKAKSDRTCTKANVSSSSGRKRKSERSHTEKSFDSWLKPIKDKHTKASSCKDTEVVRAAKKSFTEVLTWVCRYCDVQIRAENSRKLNVKRQSHLRYRHNGQKTPADRWKKIPVNPVIATSLLPPDQRDWTCPFCKCGLPACESDYQRSLSIKHHYATKHKRMKLSKARIHTQRAKLYRQNPELQPRLQAGHTSRSKAHKEKNKNDRDMKRGGHSLIHFDPNTETWPEQIKPKELFSLVTCKVCWRFGRYSSFGHASRSKTYKEKNRDVRDMKTGCHNLIHFDPNIETWPEQIKPKQLYSSVTCKVCWRFGRYSSFRQPCKPLSSRQGLRTWPILDLTNKKILAGLWNVKLEQAETYLSKVSTKVSKELATAAFDRLVKEGIEPHPGPCQVSSSKDIKQVSGIAKVPKVLILSLMNTSFMLMSFLFKKPELI